MLDRGAGVVAASGKARSSIRKADSTMKNGVRIQDGNGDHFTNRSTPSAARLEKRPLDGDSPYLRRSKRLKLNAPDRPAFNASSTDQLVARILSIANPLSMKDMRLLFHHLRQSMREFCHEFFAFDLTETQVAAWPLHELETKYGPLMRTAQYIADGSLHTWRSLFTNPNQRPYLVYGVLGEWFKQHIFLATAFGLSDEEQERLEDIDRKYIYYDAFVRAKRRAEVLQEMLDGQGLLDDVTMNAAVEKFAVDLLTVLEPLTPTFLASPEEMPSPLDVSKVAAKKARIRFELKRLIHIAVKLHLGIRLSGRDGTIVHFCEHVQKGEMFQSLAPQNCINQEYCKDTRDQPYADVLKIKMTCFCRVEAYKPIGPDQLDLENETRRLKEEATAAAATAADEVAKKVRKSNRGTGSISRSEYEKTGENGETCKGEESDGDIEFQHDFWPILPREHQDEQVAQTGVNFFGSQPPSQGIKIKRGSYVVVTQVSEADVYLEWSPDTHRNPDSAYAAKPYSLSLAEAVAQARRERHLQLWDTIRWAATKTRPIAEWMALAVMLGWMFGIKTTLPTPRDIAVVLQDVLRTMGDQTRLRTLRVADVIWGVNNAVPMGRAGPSTSSTIFPPPAPTVDRAAPLPPSRKRVITPASVLPPHPVIVPTAPTTPSRSDDLVNSLARLFR